MGKKKGSPDDCALLSTERARPVGIGSARSETK